MKLKIFIPALISIALLVPFEQWVQACGWDEDFEISFFTEVNTSNKAAYSPFRFSWSENYFGEAAHVNKDYNIEEWKNYCGKSVDENDVYMLVYRYQQDTLQQLYEYIKDKKEQVPGSIAENKMVQWLIKNKDLKTLEYILYAKDCEVYSVPLEYAFYSESDNQPGVAEIGEARADTARANKLIADGIEGYKNNKGFLKWRYGYQAVKLAYYSTQYEKTLELYDKLMADANADDFIQARSIGLKAGALYALDRKAAAAYWYSLAFDMSDEMKITTVTSFNWATKGVVDEVLPFCKTDHERAVVYVMDGLHESRDDKMWDNEMVKAYELSPTVEGLDVLMTRTLRKLEYYVYNGYSYDSYEEGIDTAKVAEIRNFAERVAVDGKNGSKSFWYMAAAYTCVLTNNMPEMKRLMDRIEKRQMNDEEQELHNILSALYLIYRNNIIDENTEAALLPYLANIEALINNQPDYNDIYRGMVNNVLATKYLYQQDTAKAVYLLARNPDTRDNEQHRWVLSEYGSSYDWGQPGTMLNSMSIAILKTVQGYYSKKNKTDFDNWVLKNTLYNYEVLRELEATKYLRERRYSEAIAVFKELPEYVREYYELPNVFAEHIKDEQVLNSKDSIKFYNRYSFATEMEKLQKQIKTEPKNAEAAYKYALGLYNTTYYGRAWQATAYTRSGSDYRAYARDDENRSTDEYYDAYDAEKYFLLAYEHAKTKELQAKAIFMAAKCWQKKPPEDISKQAPANVDGYYFTSLHNPHFKELMKYKDVKYYERVFNTCSYLRDYVKKQ